MNSPIIVNNGKTSTVSVNCMICSSFHQFDVPTQGYLDWKSRRMLIQDAMPDVDRDKRELLMTSICNCFFDREDEE